MSKHFLLPHRRRTHVQWFARVLVFTCIFSLALCLPLAALPGISQAADILVGGGGGGSGGGGEGATQTTNGGDSPLGGKGGRGGYGAVGNGNAGGGGGGGTTTTYNPTVTKGSDANGATVGAGGAGDGAGNAGVDGTSHSGLVGGNGGKGGSASLTSTATSADNLIVRAGNGGRGGQGGTAAGADGGTGGNGGDASLTINNDITVSTQVIISGGMGGNGAPTSVGSGNSGQSGNGGSVNVTVQGLMKADDVRISSGHNGSADFYGTINMGSGGTASFIADTLSTGLLRLAKNSANLAVNITTLDVTSGNTNVELGNTTVGTSGTAAGGDGVYIGTAILGNGKLTAYQGFDSGTALINTLELRGSGIFDDSASLVTLNNLTLNGGTLNHSNWAGIVDHAYSTSDITLGAGGGTVDLGAGEDKTLSRVLSGSGGLTKTGAGTLALSGTNTYSGGTTISGGTLRLTSATAAGSGAIVNNAQLEGDFSGTLDNAISGSGSFAKTGTGTLTLSGANTYSGMTSVRGGTLALIGSLASRQLALYGGTTFDNSSNSHSLDNGALQVHGQASYTGDFSAQNALLHFYVPTTMGSDSTMLDVSGTANITDSTVNVGIEGGSSPLQKGDTLTLVQAATLNGAPANTTAKGQGMQGVSLLYEFDILADTVANKLLATVSGTGPTVNPQTKALSEGRAGGMGFVNQGADLAAGQGMGSALAATSARGGAGTGQNGLAGFGTMSGGSMRYNTGSHVDVNGFSLLTGLGWRAPLPQNSLLLGVFFEAGWGNYDSHNSFSNAASVKGNGDTSYYGGGILARYDLTQGSLAGLYTEASLRAGYASTDFSSNDFGQTGGTSASYDSGAAYYGAHAGLGYVWQMNDAASLDFSTKYLWTHQNGDSVTVAGDPIRFKASDSHRWRNGARFNYAVSTELGAQFTPYVGAAYEYEFDGKARATAYGHGIASPSLKGDTGVGELGISFKPVANSAFSADLGVQGYTGMREGVTGSFQLKYEF